MVHKQLTWVQTDVDAIYEQDILRDPGQIRPWLVYADFKRQHGSLLEQAYVSRLYGKPRRYSRLTCQVLERACNHLPRSYKLWKLVGISLSKSIEID